MGNPLDTSVAAVRLISSGTLDRFPGLRVALVHAGGFLPYQVGRFDHAFDVRPEARVAIDRPPSTYLDRFWMDTITHSDEALEFLARRIGPDRLYIGTDQPFDMADAAPWSACVASRSTSTRRAAPRRPCSTSTSRPAWRRSRREVPDGSPGSDAARAQPAPEARPGQGRGARDRHPPRPPRPGDRDHAGGGRHRRRGGAGLGAADRAHARGRDPDRLPGHAQPRRERAQRVPAQPVLGRGRGRPRQPHAGRAVRRSPATTSSPPRRPRSCPSSRPAPATSSSRPSTG